MPGPAPIFKAGGKQMVPQPNPMRLHGKEEIDPKAGLVALYKLSRSLSKPRLGSRVRPPWLALTGAWYCGALDALVLPRIRLDMPTS
jgi:hypothetical protein